MAKRQKKRATEAALTYEAFLARVSPIDVYLSTCDAHFNRPHYFMLRGEDTNVTRRLDAECKVAHNEKGILIVEASIKVVMTKPENKGVGEISILELNAAFEAFFIVEDATDYPDEYAAKFATAEAKIIIWPFLREFVAATTTRMGLSPAVQIPLLIAGSPKREVVARKLVPAES